MDEFKLGQDLTTLQMAVQQLIAKVNLAEKTISKLEKDVEERKNLHTQLHTKVAGLLDKR